MKITLPALLLIACSSASAKTPPAQVTDAVLETTLSTIVLTAKAEQRLGITTQPVEEKDLTLTRTFGGEVILPLVENPQDLDSIHSLFPKLSPTEIIAIAGQQIDADALIEKAQLEHEAAQIVFNRVTTLFQSKASTQKDLDDATATLNLTQSAITAAEAKRRLLGIPIRTAVRNRNFWVRVPVFLGDLDRLQENAPAQIGNLLNRPGDPKTTGTPITVPFSSGIAGNSTSDLYFAIAEPSKTVKAGQRVSITLPLKESGKSLTIPWDAVVIDIHGGTWVYQKTAERTFQRQRVLVRFVRGDVAALESGPPIGSLVVTNGVAELFGTEFGVGK